MSEVSYEQIFGVRGKVALVTGGTRGIGLMIAEGLARCGARVYISSRKEEACQAAQQQLAPYGDVIAIPGDVSTLDGCIQLARAIGERERALHILVNNAGVTWSMPIDEFSEKAWDKVVDLDMKSPFFLTQKLLPLLRAEATPDRRSSVVNISSANGLRAGSLQNYSYVAAKAGLQQLGVQMARDLLNDNINVNTIAPGLFRSKMTAALFNSPEAEATLLKNAFMGRSGAMENIAGLVIMLSSAAGAFTTGVVIPCDGGSTTIS